jgi:hypothetical protein
VKKTILVIAVIALVAVAVLGGQALAAKPTGSSIAIETYEGCFDATDYPEGFKGEFLRESYPEVRHVSVTIGAHAFDQMGNDLAQIVPKFGCPSNDIIDDDRWWEDSTHHEETFEFNTGYWYIYLKTTPLSSATYSYAVTVTYPR